MENALKTFSELALEEYNKLNLNIVPMYPAVLIRLLPKERVSRSGLIYFPDEKVNKPVYEGIVIRSYEPKHVLVNKGRRILVESGVKPGDHILFPHWSGETVPWLNDVTLNVDNDEYRLVPARGVAQIGSLKEAGEIFGILQEASPLTKEAFHDYLNSWDREYPKSHELVDEFFEKYEIIEKIKTSRTTSGV